MDDKTYRKCTHGLTIVYTGNGKGKTTAALGLCLRAVGHGNKVAIIQFIKSNWPYGEVEGLKRLGPDVHLESLGAGCIGLPGDDKPIEEHKAAAQQALEAARQTIGEANYNTVILDEIHVAAKLNLIRTQDILELIRMKPTQMNLVLTGRDAHDDVIAAADLVTEMREIKHPFQNGYLGKQGIDF
ncbi:MAG: cob(I)yrinic acid a,c-diamide adenosyltransferase [Candidatus Zixiibacteriota bacterium]